MGDAITYEDWTRTGPIREEVDVPRPLAVNVGETRVTGAIRGGAGTTSQRSVRATKGAESERSMGYSRDPPPQQEDAHISRSGLRKWHRMQNRLDGQDKETDQWLSKENVSHMTHHVVKGYGPLGP